MEGSQPMLERTPLPKKKMAILMLVFLGDSISISVIFPFVPFLVQHFFQFGLEDQHQIGYYAGMIASTYTIGQLISSGFWGSLSDRIGRRPVMLVCMVATMTCLAVFGLSKSFYCALAARFTQGLFSGNVVVAKSYMSDITDSTNESVAFTMIGVVFGVGSFLGPLIGGVLSMPSENYPELFGGVTFLEENPYVLPCLATGFVILVDFFFALVSLDESLPTLTGGALAGSDRLRGDSGVEGGDDGAYSDLYGSTVDGGIEGEQDLSGFSPAPAPNPAKQQSPMSKLLSSRSFLVTCCVYFLFGFVFMSFNEVIPIWARGSVDVGGVGFSTAEIGVVQSTAGICTLVAVIVVYPIICERFGVVNAFRIGLAISVLFAYPIPPLLSVMPWRGNNAPTWAALLVANGLNSVGIEFGFTSVNLMLKNCAAPELAGLSLGMGSTLGLLGFALGPIAGGSMFAATLTSPSIPAFVREGRFFFIFIMLVVLANMGLTTLMPEWPWQVDGKAQAASPAPGTPRVGRRYAPVPREVELTGQ